MTHDDTTRIESFQRTGAADLENFYLSVQLRPGLSNRAAARAAGASETTTPLDLALMLNRETRCLKARYTSSDDGWFYDDSPTGPAARNMSPIDYGV